MVQIITKDWKVTLVCCVNDIIQCANTNGWKFNVMLMIFVAEFQISRYYIFDCPWSLMNMSVWFWLFPRYTDIVLIPLNISKLFSKNTMQNISICNTSAFYSSGYVNERLTFHKLVIPFINWWDVSSSAIFWSPVVWNFGYFISKQNWEIWL